MFLADAHAWIEYFTGTDKGKRAARVIDDPKQDILTLESTLAEVKGWALREKVPFEDLYQLVRQNSAIVHPTLEDWLGAAELRAGIRRKVPGFGMMDALVLAAARRTGCTVLTGDPHFRKVAGVQFLG